MFPMCFPSRSFGKTLKALIPAKCFWTEQKLNRGTLLYLQNKELSLANYWLCARASYCVLKAQLSFSFKKENNTLKKLKTELWILPSCAVDGEQPKGRQAVSADAPPSASGKLMTGWTTWKSPPHSPISRDPSVPFCRSCDWMRKLWPWEPEVETKEARLWQALHQYPN